MLINCCKELTWVSWFTMSWGLMGLSGSCAFSWAVNNEMNSLGSPSGVLAADEFEVLDVAIAAGVTVDAKLFTCIFLPPRYEFETSCQNAQPGIYMSCTQIL